MHVKGSYKRSLTVAQIFISIAHLIKASLCDMGKTFILQIQIDACTEPGS